MFMIPETRIGLRECLRGIRSRYACNALIPRGSQDWQVIYATVQRHPRWPEGFTSGIRDFRTGRLQGRNQQGFRKTDDFGLSQDIDLRACLNGDPPSEEDFLIEAAINAVKPLFSTFFDGPPRNCGLCGIGIGHKFSCLITHKERSGVYTVWRNFRELNPGAMATKDGEFVELGLADIWREYWLDNAKLMRVCSRCFYRVGHNV